MLFFYDFLFEVFLDDPTGRMAIHQGGICFAVTSAVLSAVVARSVAAADANAASAPASSCGVARNATTTCLGARNDDSKLCGGFKYFFIFTPILGEMIHFDEYFPNGLVQPPTRNF